MHPSDRLRGATDSRLAGKTIVLGVTGSIAAVRTVELARELIRHGARVIPVMTKDATKIIHPYALEFATGVRPIVELTGAVEHVALLGQGGEAHLLLVAPATGNTLSKMALGIDDSTVTTCFSARRRDVPVLVAPAMHDTMYDNPFLVENLQKLRDAGIHFVEPKHEEGKAKLAEPDEIVEDVLRLLGPQLLARRKILVINGATREPLDAMRVLTNKSTGRTGAALAREAYRYGADVTHWYGHGELGASELPRVPTRRFETVEDLLRMAPETRGFDAVLVPAALSDFAPEAAATGKIPSAAPHALTLQPLPKVIDALRRHAPVVVSFKAEGGLDDAALVQRARESMKRSGSRFVVANHLEQVTAARHRVLLVDGAGATPVEGTNDQLAQLVLQRLAKELGG